MDAAISKRGRERHYTKQRTSAAFSTTNPSEHNPGMAIALYSRLFPHLNATLEMRTVVDIAESNCGICRSGEAQTTALFAWQSDCTSVVPHADKVNDCRTTFNNLHPLNDVMTKEDFSQLSPLLCYIKPECWDRGDLSGGLPCSTQTSISGDTTAH